MQTLFDYLPAAETKPRTVILSNGSKWTGESPDPVAKLFKRLADGPLYPGHAPFSRVADPVYGEAYGFTGDATLFFGNFWLVSGSFQIVTNDGKLVKRLSEAIRANVATEDYRQAFREWASDCQCITCFDGRIVGEARCRKLGIEQSSQEHNRTEESP